MSPNEQQSTIEALYELLPALANLREAITKLERDIQATKKWLTEPGLKEKTQ